MRDSHLVGPNDGTGAVAIVPYDPANHAEDWANAHLLAAAPDLLAALQGALQALESRHGFDRTIAITEARAAIVKARGDV
jgi:hypothetical protein